MSDISDLLGIQKCNCGRSGCEYFAAGVGEFGSSYSKEGVSKLLEDAKKLVAELEALLIH